MFNNLTLNRKIIGVQCISLLLLVCVLAFSAFELADLSERNKQSIQNANDTVSVMIQLDNMNFAVLREAKAAKDVWLRGTDPDEKEKSTAEFNDQLDNFQTHQAIAEEKLDVLVKADPTLESFSSGLKSVSVAHKAMSDKYLAQIKVHVSTAESDAKVKGIDRAVFRQLQELRGNFVKAVEKKGLDNVIAIDQQYNIRLKIIGGVALLAIVLLLAISSLFVRSVARQLGGDPQDVLAVVANMASGNLLSEPNKMPADDSVLAHVYAMQNSIRNMISQVKDRSIHVGDMARSLAASAQQIAANVNTESSAVSSMAAAIEQLSVSTEQISEQGNNAGQIASQSRSNAEDGSHIINKTVSGLLATAQEIEGASAEVSRLGDDASRISDIVKVIREIADQTNLLALNAAIEAARAGEQGRGFAVVADEVRKLAERTANATNEINQMSSKIGDVAGNALAGMDKVVQTTRQGVTDAEFAQTSIANIQQSFTDVANVIHEISSSLSEQNSAANDLAHNTEKVASMSEENAVAAQQLLGLANDLQAKAQEVRQSVEIFRV
jgi:methyl-accepting chemotaxis protein